MWEMLFKQLGINPAEVKGQAAEAFALIKQFNTKLDRIILLLENKNAENIQKDAPLTILLNAFTNGEKTHEQ